MKEEAEKVADELGNNITDSKDLIEYLRNVDAQRLINAVHSLVNQKVRFGIIKLRETDCINFYIYFF